MLKPTRHNGRAGKHSTYNPKHNDHSFDLANSEHIDPERVPRNIYWDCYNGIRSAMQPQDSGETFEDVEKLYYKLHYTDFVEKQNARNAKIRHTERNRSIEGLLTSKKTCPEETIYQLGTLENHASPKELFSGRYGICRRVPQPLWQTHSHSGLGVASGRGNAAHP